MKSIFLETKKEKKKKELHIKIIFICIKTISKVYFTTFFSINDSFFHAAYRTTPNENSVIKEKSNIHTPLNFHIENHFTKTTIQQSHANVMIN